MKRANSHAIEARPEGHQEDTETMMPTEKETDQKIKEDKDTTSKDAIDNLHRNGKTSSPSKFSYEGSPASPTNITTMPSGASTSVVSTYHPHKRKRKSISHN